jgi:hypothetical protein
MISLRSISTRRIFLYLTIINKKSVFIVAVSTLLNPNAPCASHYICFTLHLLHVAISTYCMHHITVHKCCGSGSKMYVSNPDSNLVWNRIRIEIQYRIRNTALYCSTFTVCWNSYNYLILQKHLWQWLLIGYLMAMFFKVFLTVSPVSETKTFAKLPA